MAEVRIDLPDGSSLHLLDNPREQALALVVKVPWYILELMPTKDAAQYIITQVAMSIQDAIEQYFKKPAELPAPAKELPLGSQRKSLPLPEDRLQKR